MKKYLEWQLAKKIRKDDAGEFFSCVVPSNVQIDYAKVAGLPKDIHYAENSKMYEGLEDFFWEYKSVINIENEGDKKIYFVSLGIDYKYDIFINNQKIFSNEGSFYTVCLDITKFISKNNLLKVLIYPAPKKPTNIGHPATQCCKPAVSYGWDFSAKVIPLGIFKDTFILIEDAIIENIKIDYLLNDKLTKARVDFEFKAQGNFNNFIINVFDKNNNLVLSTNKKKFTIENVKLWNVRGYGEQYLYYYELILFNNNIEVAKKNGKFGLKKVELTINEGVTAQEKQPFTANYSPFTLTINNIKIFGKGSNFVNPELFFANNTKEVYDKLLKDFVDCNFNLLRCWGGFALHDDSLYELCDELGIMVWQEFPLACGNYVSTKKYLNILKNEAKNILIKTLPHACIVLLCAGNELFNDWSGMNDQSLAVRLLNKLCFEHAKNIPFLQTSPINGVGHGSYKFIFNGGKDLIQNINESKMLAYTEFGVPSLANIDYLKSIIPIEELNNFKPEKSLVHHKVFKQWIQDEADGGWLYKKDIEGIFGKIKSIEKLIEYSNLLQCVGLQYVYEEARRQAPVCSMALNWCFNEPWKNACNLSLLSYPNEKKPAFYLVKKALQPKNLTLRYEKFCYKTNEIFNGDIYFLNEFCEDVFIETISIKIDKHFLKTLTVNKNINKNSFVETFKIKLQQLNKGLHEVEIYNEFFENKYVFITK